MDRIEFMNHIGLCHILCTNGCGETINLNEMALHKSTCIKELINCSAFDIGCVENNC
jgi:hypothetical protein